MGKVDITVILQEWQVNKDKDLWGMKLEERVGREFRSTIPMHNIF